MAKNLKKQTNKQIFNKHTTKCKIIQINAERKSIKFKSRNQRKKETNTEILRNVNLEIERR